MSRYRLSVRTDRSVEDVFDYMADLRNFPEWDPGTKKAVQVKGNGPGPDAEFDLDASGGTLRYIVTSYGRPRKVVARAENRFITSVDTIEVSADGDGSIVSYDAELTLNGLLKVADPLLQLAFNRIGGKAADGLVETLPGTRVD